jgi:hypothetical protein
VEGMREDELSFVWTCIADIGFGPVPRELFMGCTPSYSGVDKVVIR